MSEITVADGLLAQGEPFHDADGVLVGWSSSPGFLVTSEDVDGAAAALHAAGLRFFRLEQGGRELDESEMDDGYYTPNYVSAVHLTDLGLMLWADTKGDLSQEMGQAMVAILVEELTARGMGAHIAPLPYHFDPGVRTWTPPPA